VTVYRICSSAYPKNDGEGAKLHGGRWNHKGTPLLYCGSTVSLCALEVLANSEKLPKDMIVIAAEIPDRLQVPEYSEGDLPIDWNAPIPPLLTKDLGTTWAKSRTSLAISVPSAIVPDERNYLVNPLHPDFSKIKFSHPRPFVFDPRLKK
jgi:RES domain-containing protein